MNTKTMTQYALLSVAACLATACANTSQPEAISDCTTWEMQRKNQSTAFAGLNVMSTALAYTIGVQSHILGRSTNGNLSVQTRVYNCSEQNLVLVMRTQFSDKSGMQSEPNGAWRTVYLGAKGNVAYGEIAISGKSESVMVDIDDGNRAQIQNFPMDAAPATYLTAPGNTQ